MVIGLMIPIISCYALKSGLAETHIRTIDILLCVFRAIEFSMLIYNIDLDDKNLF